MTSTLYHRTHQVDLCSIYAEMIYYPEKPESRCGSVVLEE
ncbi:hypothetical protein K3495_g10892 [Podosphaera aphanis]|nr:hypothetical protein K3495_g10892 [Podosphaera aphanis]